MKSNHYNLQTDLARCVARTLTALLVASSLAACSGGGGGSTTTGNSPGTLSMCSIRMT